MHSANVGFLTLIGSVVLLVSSAWGQPDPTDSLLLRLKDAPADTSTINALFAAVIPLEYSDPPKALRIYQHLHSASEKLGNRLEAGQCLLYSGMTYSNLNDMDSARSYYERAITDFQSIDAGSQIGAAYTNMGNTYSWEGDFATAGDFYEKALEKFEENADSGRLFYAYNNLAAALSGSSLYDLAIEYNHKALKIAITQDNAGQQALSQHDLGVGYMNLNRPDDARPHFLFAKEVADSLEDLQLGVDIYRSLADLEISSGHHELGEQYATRALEIAEIRGVPLYIAAAQYRLGKAKLALSQYDAAERLLKDAIKGSKEVGSLAEVPEMYDVLALLKRTKSEFKEADQYMLLSQKLRDSLVMNEQAQYLANLERRYQVAKKEQEITQQELVIERQERGLERNRAISIGLLLALLAAAGFIYSLFQQRKVSRALQEEKLTTIRQANQLSVANAMLEGQESERARIAKDLHDGLGGLMLSIRLQVENLTKLLERNSEDKALDLIDHASTEVRRIAHDMMPSALDLLGLDGALLDLCNEARDRFAGDLHFNVKGISWDLPQNVRVNIYRIIQETLQNAIKHSSASQLSVNLEYGKESLIIRIEDDGVGFELESSQKKMEGLGLSSLQSRTEAANAELEILTAPNEGTKIRITLPRQD